VTERHEAPRALAGEGFRKGPPVIEGRLLWIGDPADPYVASRRLGTLRVAPLISTAVSFLGWKDPLPGDFSLEVADFFAQHFTFRPRGYSDCRCRPRCVCDCKVSVIFLSFCADL
jgi:hypothetical protein